MAEQIISMKKWQVEYTKKDINKENIVQILLENRGIKTKKEIKDFLKPNFKQLTSQAVEINSKELKKAIERIKKAIKKKEKIIVFGDYDVDGICGSAILWETLNNLKADVLPYIPSRFEEGYGLSISGIDNILKTQEIGLIITVDNGIVANEAVDYANKKKIDVIVTDHHVPSKNLPKALAIVHTTLVCGAAVAYLLSKELSKDEKDHLSLVALATVADLVPLINANRTLLTFGLESLRKTKRPGLIALIEKARIEKKSLGVYEIGHMIAPRLNAMGRLESAMDSLRLVCTTNKERAEELASTLTKTNLERQQMTMQALENAKGKVKNKELKNLIFIADESYQQGIVGLVAGRMVEEYYLPSIVISKGEKLSRASARSVKGFNIIEFLRSASDLLIDVGGHPMAAGFTVETAKLEILEKKLFETAEKLIKKEHLERLLRIDLELPINLVNAETYEEIQKLSPFGMANPEPTFITPDLTVQALRAVGSDGKHIKLKLNYFEAIYFGAGANNKFSPGDIVDIVYTLDENEWNGNKTLQLKIRDIVLSAG